MLEKLEPNATVRAQSRTALAVLVFGMHRSGTSALSGVLNLLGVATPRDLHPADKHNSRGYFEPQAIIDFHERLLAELGSPSDDPLPLRYDWVESPVGGAAADELAGLLDEAFGAEPLCLFKDPRMCRLAPVWTAALARSGRSGVAVLPCRHPLEVAGSLQAKAGLSRAYSLFMWLQHVLLAERFTRKLPRSFTFYDELLADWRTVARKLEVDLGLTWPRDLMRAGVAIDAFLSGEMRHHAAPAGGLDPTSPLEALCQRAWAGLGRLGDAPYDAEATAELDRVWEAFDAAIGVAGPLIVSYQGREGELEDSERLLKAQLARRDLHLEEADRRVADRDRQILGREALLVERDRRIEALGREVVERDARIEEDAERLRRIEAALATAKAMAAAERRLAADTRIAYARAAERARALELAYEQRSAEANHSQAMLDAIQHSTFWAVSHPIRQAITRYPGLRRAGRRALKLAWWMATLKLGAKLRDRRATLEAPAAPSIPPPPAPAAATASPSPFPAAPEPPPEPDFPNLEPAIRRRGLRTRDSRHLYVVFVSGEPKTPGHAYRIRRWAEAAGQVGATSSIYTAPEAAEHLDEIARADLLFVWRVPWGPELEPLALAARAAGTPFLYDIDDLMFEPELATVELIDGIRSQGFDPDEVRRFYARFAQAIGEADYCSAPTHVLAARMRRLWKPAFVLPNGFEDETFRRSRLAARRRRAAPDGLVRIGYATGSKTHQKDFAQCAGAVAEVLRARPQARLVLFKLGQTPVLDLAEFPAYDDLRHQVEWRELVPIADLPDEIARFDVSIAPLEVGNIFCEAKSELKFFEAALAGAVTVASPTEPFRRSVRDGETGFLPADEAAWRSVLLRLVDDPALRAATASAALFDALAEYGPERRAEALQSVLEQVVAGGRRAARAFELDLHRAGTPKRPSPHIPPHEVVFESDRLGVAEVSVVVPLYNYARFIEEALESVRGQSLEALDLIVVDDASTDDSLAVARRWLEQHAGRFNRAVLIRNTPNAGLGFTRNVGFAAAETRFVLPLDADNRLAPEMCEQALAAADRSGAALVYARIRQFGDGAELMGDWRYDPARLISGNFIDAMALVRRSAWADVGGYDHVRYGWEDYDFWCRFAERGHFAERLFDVLAGYRVHGGSMLRAETDLIENKRRLIEDLERRHRWLRVDRPPELDDAVRPPPRLEGSGPAP